ncbi:MAG: methyltransferase family protein [Bacteroidota bacterium]
MIISWIVWSSWWASEFILSISARSSARDMKGRDKGTFIILWFIIALAVTGGVLLAIKTRYFIGSSLPVHFTGLGIIIAGMVLRFYSVSQLGRFFTVDVTIRENHELKKDGIYSLLRHPSYSGSILSFAGFGISLNNWLSLAVAFLPVLAVFLYRIHVEEKTLTDRFGEEYVEYQKNSYRLLPWIY